MENKPQAVFEALEALIRERQSADAKSSYTASLLHGKLDTLLKKVGEEATEVVIAGKGDEREALIYESADLLYHLLVLLVRKGIALEEIAIELSRRSGISGLVEKANRKE